MQKAAFSLFLDLWLKTSGETCTFNVPTRRAESGSLNSAQL